MMKWIKKEISNSSVKQLMKQFGLDPLAAAILVRREVTEADRLLFYLEKSERYLHMPFHFHEMEDAVDRILQAREEGEKVRIFGDRDVDGITSTVIIHNALTALGIDVSWSVPVGDDNYGLTFEALDKFAGEQGSLIITVDCGISNFDEINHASSLGIDTIVTDHHNPPSQLPHAVALINPKIEDSGYPFAHLAGCAVASKLAVALQIAQTSLYKRDITLLNIEEVNEAFEITALKVRNLVEVDRIRETVVPGIFDLDRSNLKSFLVGQQIIVFEEDIQKRYLQKCFGNSTEILLFDMAPEIWKRYSKLNQKSLYKLKSLSTLGKYCEEEASELDVFFNLYLTFMMDRHSRIKDAIYADIELVAIGTIGDLMPLENENRLLVSLGLKKINNKHLPDMTDEQRPSKSLMQLLYEKNFMDKPVYTTDIAWQISPVINATGRLGVPDKAVTFFLEPDSPQLRERAKDILSLNEQRKKLVAKIWDKYLPKARRSHEELNGRFVIIGGKDIHRGVTGILASRLSEFFQAPALAAAFLDDKAVGSCRSYGGVNVKELLESFEDYFNDYGGHDFAAGFNLPLDDWGTFAHDFSDVVKNLEDGSSDEEILQIDAELTHPYFKPDIADTAALFEPYGEGNPPLVFMVKNVLIESLDLIGKKNSDHVRMTIAAGAHKWVALFWNGASRAGIDFNKGENVDIAFRLHRNYYKSRESLQLVILDIRRIAE